MERKEEPTPTIGLIPLICHLFLIAVLTCWGVIASYEAAEWHYQCKMTTLYYNELVEQHKTLMDACSKVGEIAEERNRLQKTLCPPCSKQIKLRYPITEDLGIEPGTIQIPAKPEVPLIPKEGIKVP